MGETIAIAALWRLGTFRQPPHLAREVTLSNQIALLSAGATLPYQAYYLTDISHYHGVLAANILFIASYLTTLLLNHAERFHAARAVLLGTIYIQLFVVTSFLSTAAGVHLFYFALGASLGMLFANREQVVTLLLAGLAALLLVVCHFAFPPGTTPVVIPESTGRVMYVASAAGAVLLTGGLSYLFRLHIDRAESALTQSNRVLERLTTVDPVTGLANRRALDTYLTSEWRRLAQHGGSLSVALADVDCFKAYNDHYGHLAGDRCLQRIAEALSTATQQPGTMIARYGGEEFVIVLPATSEGRAAEVAEHARSAVMDLDLPHDYSSVAAAVTVSIGVAGGGPDELESFADLLHRADSALYAAKHDGRNSVVCWETLEADATLTARRRRLTARVCYHR